MSCNTAGFESWMDESLDDDDGQWVGVPNESNFCDGTGKLRLVGVKLIRDVNYCAVTCGRAPVLHHGFWRLW